MTQNLMTALLLEDEPLIAMSIEDELGAAGFAVSTVMTCLMAGSWLDARRPDIVIVDIQLADGSSHEVVSRLIEANVPFVVHSGDHPSIHEGTPFAKGRWVSKPSAANELAEAARSLLQRVID